MVSRKNGSKSRRLSKALLITAAGILVFGAAAWALDNFNVIDLPFFADKKATENDNGINYGPPTEEEKQETERYKDSLGNQNNTGGQDNTSQGQKRSVTPVITAWGQTPGGGDVEVAGYVNVVEGGGICTAQLTKSGQTVTASRSATQNAQNVSCGFITIARSKLSPGQWQVTLNYSSDTSEGSSKAVTLEVK